MSPVAHMVGKGPGTPLPLGVRHLMNAADQDISTPAHVSTGCVQHRKGLKMNRPTPIAGPEERTCMPSHAVGSRPSSLLPAGIPRDAGGPLTGGQVPGNTSPRRPAGRVERYLHVPPRASYHKRRRDSEVGPQIGTQARDGLGVSAGRLTRRRAQVRCRP